MSEEHERPCLVLDDVLLLGGKTVCVLTETPIRLIKSYICSVDIKATEAEKAELVACVRKYFLHFSQDFSI